MSFVGKVWKLLVGIKDALVLLLLLLFFVGLFSLLSATPNPTQIREGALYIDLAGFVVEERSAVDPFATLLSGEAPASEYQARDVVRALDKAASDDRIKAVVLDLSRFVGGGQVHMQAIANAMSRVREAEKPVLTYAIGYGDDHMHLASHASEVWLDPLGGALITGPGGSRLYYGELLDKLKINARIFKVGEFKSAVEPFERNSMSEPALENARALYGALWEEWQANVKKARPELDLARVTKQPADWVEGTSGDLAKAALEAGLVDKLGGEFEFSERVRELVGEDDWSDEPGSYAKTDFGDYLGDIESDDDGKAIAVVTVAGNIVDGDAGLGTAGGSRIAGLLNDALDDEYAGLVVRVDSPGGSVLASEEIRRAIERFRGRDLPVAISFANVAASGGYWVATAGDRIFAQPETITGSIGVFAVLPTFENATVEIGINADGYRTTPLSGQPDLVAGLSPEVERILQASVGDTYSDFLERVSKARSMSIDKVDNIAQGRVWDGGTARQLNLVDAFGGLDAALAWVAGEAGLEENGFHPRFLGESEASYDALIRQLLSDRSNSGGGERAANRDLFAMFAGAQKRMVSQMVADANRLSGSEGVQAYCLACANEIPTRTPTSAQWRGASDFLAQSWRSAQ